MKFFERILFYLKFLGLTFEYSGCKGIFLQIYFWFIIFALGPGTSLLLYYYLQPYPMSFVEICNMVASLAAGAEFTFTVMSIYLKRRQFQEFMDVLEKLKNRGKFSAIYSTATLHCSIGHQSSASIDGASRWLWGVLQFAVANFVLTFS
jgi:hypothetical protein